MTRSFDWLCHAAVSRPLFAAFTALSLLTAGCRAGDPDSCLASQNACTNPGDRAADDLAFSSRGYDSCRDAVSDNGCGIDAETLRTCVDSLATPLCVGVEFQDFSPQRLFETTECKDALDAFLACEDGDSRSSSSRPKDKDWYDD